jgi:hypothetical protein
MQPIENKWYCIEIENNLFLLKSFHPNYESKFLNDWFRKTGQHGRIKVAGSKVVDKELNITDHDIEEAVLEGARTFEEVCQKLKVGVGRPPEIRHDVEQLIRFYSDKYYG